MDKDPILWEECTWPEIRDLTERTKMVIIPFGSTEQHGYHLPLNTDTETVYYIAKRVSAETRVPVAPPLPYCCSQGHIGFPGTMTLRSETLTHVTQELCQSLYKTGIRKILLLNGHMYNIGPLLSARENLKDILPDLLIKTMNYWDVLSAEFSKLDAEDCPVVFGRPVNIHGNISETAYMLAIRPDLVKMDRAVNDPGYQSHFDYPFNQVSKTGAIGTRITEATADRGNRIIDAAVEGLCQYVRAQMEEGPKYPPE